MITEPRLEWLTALNRLVGPVLASASKSMLKQSIGGSETAHLEAASRVVLGISPWLMQSDGSDYEVALRSDLKKKAVQMIKNGLDYKHRDFFSFGSSRQSLVEAGLLSAAILNSGFASEIDGVVEAVSRTNNITHPTNNWVLFPALVEALRFKLGRSCKFNTIATAVAYLDRWYVGDGLYKDGTMFACDYYNSIMIHPLLHVLLTAIKGVDSRCDSLLIKHNARLTRYADLQERSISPNGEYPVTGRSLCYRTGVFHALAYAALTDLLPSGTRPEQVRSALFSVISKVLGEESYRKDGFLNIGVVGKQKSLGEQYINAGSCYMASVVFLPLALPPEHLFWSGSFQPWSSKKVFSGYANPQIDKKVS